MSSMDKSKIYLWAVGGGYLVYLGIQQFVLLWRKEASIPWLNVLAGLLFIAVGGAVLVREWKAHKALNAPAEPAEEAAGEDCEEEDGEEEDGE